MSLVLLCRKKFFERFWKLGPASAGLARRPPCIALKRRDDLSSSISTSSTKAATMEAASLRAGFRRAITSTYNPAKRRLLQPRRFYATPTDSQQPPREEIRAAAPIRFTDDADQFSRPRAELIDSPRNSRGDNDNHLLRRIRILPASPSYFTATPRYTDDLLYLSSLLRRHALLPQLPPGQASRVAWNTLQQYRTELGEPVRVKGYSSLLSLLKRLNYIHPSLLPTEVQHAMAKYKRSVQPHLNIPKPIVPDLYGRTRAVGRRKSSHAACFLVEGTGEVLINGKTLVEYFGRLHDRESAVWALKTTGRLDKYNVFCIVKGGGTTGQAEAITLGVAKALLAHEPGLKAALRRGEWSLLPLGGCLKAVLTVMFCCSQRCDTRSETSREKEAWQAQSQEDACVGQAVEDVCTLCIILSPTLLQPVSLPRSRASAVVLGRGCTLHTTPSQANRGLFLGLVSSSSTSRKKSVITVWIIATAFWELASPGLSSTLSCEPASLAPSDSTSSSLHEKNSTNSLCRGIGIPNFAIQHLRLKMSPSAVFKIRRTVRSLSFTTPTLR